MATNPTAGRSLHGNIASPETATEAAVEWTTEDFMAAEPYPMPEVTDEMIQEFLDATASPSVGGGSTSPGGPPSDGGPELMSHRINIVTENQIAIHVAIWINKLIVQLQNVFPGIQGYGAIRMHGQMRHCLVSKECRDSIQIEESAQG